MLCNVQVSAKMLQLKILLVGPCKSGKTTIANFLSDSTDNNGDEYRPTQGVRIVEFEANNLNISNRNIKAEIELWDCSGDRKFENCWPALHRDAQGIVFVYDPAAPEQIPELDYMYESFVNQSGLNAKSCLVIENCKSSEIITSGPISKSNLFSRVPQVHANVEEDGNKLRSDFYNYVSSLINGVRDRNEQEELNMLTV